MKKIILAIALAAAAAVCAPAMARDTHYNQRVEDSRRAEWQHRRWNHQTERRHHDWQRRHHSRHRWQQPYR